MIDIFVRVPGGEFWMHRTHYDRVFRNLKRAHDECKMLSQAYDVRFTVQLGRSARTSTLMHGEKEWMRS